MKSWILLTLLVSPMALLAFEIATGSLLNWKDAQWLQERNIQGPRLSGAIDDDNPWESFDTWQCFHTKSINMGCAKYDGAVDVPGIVVEEGGRTLLFDTHVEDKLNCIKTVDAWSELLGESARICIMAAEMPGAFVEEEDTSLWYIHAIKTELGYWALN